MTDPLHSLKPEHGEKVKILKNKENWDMMVRIGNHYNQLSIDIIGIFNLKYEGDYSVYSCRQCLKNVALNTKDLANLLQELSEK